MHRRGSDVAAVFCDIDASLFIAHAVFSSDVRRNGCFLLTCVREARDSEFGVHDPDSQNIR
jgi:hypothetical protein